MAIIASTLWIRYLEMVQLKKSRNNVKKKELRVKQKKIEILQSLLRKMLIVFSANKKITISKEVHTSSNDYEFGVPSTTIVFNSVFTKKLMYI